MDVKILWRLLQQDLATDLFWSSKKQEVELDITYKDSLVLREMEKLFDIYTVALICFLNQMSCEPIAAACWFLCKVKLGLWEYKNINQKNVWIYPRLCTPALRVLSHLLPKLCLSPSCTIHLGFPDTHVASSHRRDSGPTWETEPYPPSCRTYTCMDITGSHF